MLLVSRDRFAETLVRMLVETLEDAGPVAFFVEREPAREPKAPLEKKGKILPLFDQPNASPVRATGKAPAASSRPAGFDTGSEGVVGQLVTELCRARPEQAFDNPGPDVIRDKHIRRLVVVTDCIGSGERVKDALTAAWKVASIRAWWSNRAKYGMSFSVVAFAATDQGRRLAESHPSKPDVRIASKCPTVADSFSQDDAERVGALCARYAPDGHSPRREKRGAVRRALGYGGTGSLIAFAHGAPNNSPTVLWRSGPGWNALFVAGVTASARADFDNGLSAAAVADRLVSMRQTRLASGMVRFGLAGDAGAMVLTLAASARTPGNTPAIGANTGLTADEVGSAVKGAVAAGWLDAKGHLTDAGHRQLDSFRSKRAAQTRPVQSGPVEAYYPGR
jgi:hypothetical protein